jgi:flavin-dependent dehydrogenase
MKTFDVIVCGDGPCGIAAACRLEEQDVRAVVVAPPLRERRHRIETLHSTEVLEHILPRQAIGEGDGMRPHAGGVSWWTGEPENTSPGWTVDRAVFEPALHDMARAMDVPVIHGDGITLTSAGDAWTVECGGRKFTGRVVISAAGRHAGQRTRLTSWRQIALTARCRFLREPVPVWSEPLADGWLWCVHRNESAEVTVFADPGHTHGPPGERMEALLAQSRLHAKIELTSPVMSSEVTPSAFSDKTSAGPPLLPAGDAAVARDPLAAQGLAAAVSDGAAAAAAAAACLSGDRENGERFLAQRRAMAARRHVREIAVAYDRASRGEPFWLARSRGAHLPATAVSPDAWHPHALLRRSDAWTISSGLALRDRNIVTEPMLVPRSPGRDPVAWFAGHPAADFLPADGETISAVQLAARWIHRGLLRDTDVPEAVRWFAENEILVSPSAQA